MKEAIQYHIFKQIQDNPEVTQRELAIKAGTSLGKVNYCLKALMDKGLIKAINFKNSRRKSAYLYKLTPKGLDAKAKLTVRFLKYKMAEYDRLRAEIEELRGECDELAVKNEELFVREFTLISANEEGSNICLATPALAPEKKCGTFYKSLCMPEACTNKLKIKSSVSWPSPSISNMLSG